MTDDSQADGRRLISRGLVHAWDLDHYGHMSVRWYGHLFDDASFVVFVEFGIDMQELIAEHGIHTVTAQANTSFLKELKAGDVYRIDGAIARVGTKSITLHLRMLHEITREVHAEHEVVDVFFDPETRTSTAIPPAVRTRLERHVLAG